MPSGKLPAVGRLYSVTVPVMVMRATLAAFASATQRAPSGPRAMPYGLLPAVGRLYSVGRPVAREKRATLFA